MRNLSDSQFLDGHTPQSGGATVTTNPGPSHTIDPWHERGVGLQPNGKPSFTIDEAAVQLTRSGLTQNGQDVLGTAATVTYAFRASAAVMPEDTGGFSVFSAAQIKAAELALSTWSDVANVTFVRVGAGTAGPQAFSNNAELLFGNYATGAASAAAFAYYPGDNAAGSADSDLWVNNTLDYNAKPIVGEYGQQVLVHEIGHTLGLSHPSDYDASDATDPTYENSAQYFEDSRQYSVMSYFGGVNTGAAFLFFSSVPMMDDIAAAQRLYGANMTTRTGDTVYGFNSNADQPWYKAITTDDSDLVFCVWDAGGHDTFDFSQYSSDALIDLRQGHFSSIGNSVGNVSIAQGAVIEDALGGAGNDLMIGNDSANFLSGSDGRDTFIGGAGADRLDGGLGSDTASYQTATAGVHVDIAAATASGGDAEGDVLVSIENLVGSAFDDTLTGDASANTLNGGAGDDVLNGGAGADSMVGGDGNDTFYVDDQSDSVIENASALNSTADVLFTAFSTVVPDGIEIVHLTGDSDAYLAATGSINYSLFGNAGANTVTGGSGNDYIDGGLGADTLTGGLGNDTFIVDNIADTVTEGDAGGNDIVMASANFVLGANIESLTLVTGARTGTGNALDNVITGNASSNKLFGLDGNDVLTGGRSVDTMIGGNGNDTYYVDNIGDIVTELHGGGNDTVNSSVTYTLSDNVEKLLLTGTTNISGFGNAGNNTIVGNDGNNKVLGGDGADTLGGGAGNDTLDGGKGIDNMKGGAGNDKYYLDTSADLVTEYTNGGTDTIQINGTYTLTNNVENLIIVGSSNRYGTGNALDNHITGNAGNNTLGGAAGNDIIDGGKGADLMRGGTGDDTFYVDNNGDVVAEYTNAGNDSVFSSVSFVLGGNIETLTLTGAANLNGAGNSLDNILTGNSGDNVLTGGKGHDTLTGGLGADTFVFAANSGADTIADFSVGDNDMINVNAYTHGTANPALISQSGADTVIDLGGGNVVTIVNTTFDDPGLTSHIVW